MASINEILGRNIDSVKELRKAIGELQNSLIGLDTESQEYKNTTAKLTAAQEELTKVTQAGKVSNDAAKDSIVGMEQEYKKLYNTYKMLTEEQRSSDFGKEMAASLETLSTKLNETKQGVGNFKDNIGRYAGSVTEAFNSMGISAGAMSGPLKTATTGAKGFNTALKSLAANPVVLVITALVAILGKAAAAIKDNEELTNRLKEAMSVFKPILDAVSNAFDFLAGILVKTIEGLSKVAEKVMSIIPGMKSAIDSHKELAKATNDLTKAQREANVENSKKTAEIERLREEASATEDVTEKKRLLEEAKAMQAEVDQKNIELAQEELRIQQEYAEKTANSAEENEKLAAAQRKVNDAIAQGERNMRQYNKQITQVENKTKSAASAGKNWREEAKKLYEQTIEDSKTEIQKLTEKYEKEKKLLEKYHYDTRLLTVKYEKEIRDIRLEEAKKSRTAMSTVYNEYYDNMVRYYKNMKTMAKDAWEANALDADYLQTSLRALQTFQASASTIIGKTGDDFGNLFKTILVNSDISKLEDYNYVENIIKYFSTDDEQMNKMLRIFHGFGEQSWMEYISGMTENVNMLNSVFGLDIKNLGDVEARVNELGKKILETFGNSVTSNVDNILADDMGRLWDSVYQMIYKGSEGMENPWPADKSIFNTSWMKEYILGEEYKILEDQKLAYEKELENFSGTTEQKLEILQRYYAIVEEMDERHNALSELNQQRTMEMVQSLGDATDSLGSAMGTMKSSYESLIDSEVKAGKIDQKTADDRKKRLEKLEIAEQSFAIATIAADAASGLFSIWKGYATEVGTVNPQTAAAAGPASAAVLAGLNAKSLVSAIAKTTGLAATATAQIMAARNGIVSAQNNMSAESGGGADAGVGVTPVLIDSTPYSYTRTVQTEEDVQNLNQQPIWVSVEDISSALGQQVTVKQESSF